MTFLWLEIRKRVRSVSAGGVLVLGFGYCVPARVARCQRLGSTETKCPSTPVGCFDVPDRACPRVHDESSCDLAERCFLVGRRRVVHESSVSRIGGVGVRLLFRPIGSVRSAGVPGGRVEHGARLCGPVACSCREVRLLMLLRTMERPSASVAFLAYEMDGRRTRCLYACVVQEQGQLQRLWLRRGGE